MKLNERISLIKAGITGQSVLTMASRFLPAYGEPPRRSTDDWIDLFNKSPRMNPIHLIASDVATSAYGIYKKNDKRKTDKLQNTDVERLLKSPNQNLTMTEYVLFYITQVYLMLPSGEAFWIKERNKTGKVTEVWPVPPGWVNEIPSKTNDFFIIYPQGNMNAAPIHVPPFDMVYFKKPDVTNPYLRGIGRANGIGDEIETDEYMAKYQKRFFFNDGIPPMVGMMPGADEQTVIRQKEKWQQEYGGYNNPHKVGWLNWDAKFQVLKQTEKELDFIESRKYLRDTANQHFFIPPELFGILENSNRSTIDASYYLYTKNVLRKELKFIDDVLNIQLISELDPTVVFEHDNVVPEDDEFELKKASEGLKNGGILVDEWRQANGWEPLPNGVGQILYTPLNMMPTKLNGNVNVQPEPQMEPKQLNKTFLLEQKERAWLILDKASTKNEQNFINNLKRYFQSQQDRIINSLEKSVKSATDNPDDLMDWGKEDSALLSLLTPLWMSSMKEGATAANDTFGFGIGFDVLNPMFAKWVDKYGAGRVKDINATTKEKLQKTLSEGISEGEGIPKLKNRVLSVMGEAKTSRATKIARTETHNTVESGTRETYKAAGVKKKEWLTSMDGRERENHASINGEVVNMDDSFSNGLDFPGDPSGDPEEVVNCRCVLLPVI
ncbi:MAG: phage portal protein [Eubacteriales bacterium]|nr:phage portal protein [Eubacteriales bacterium]